MPLPVSIHISSFFNPQCNYFFGGTMVYVMVTNSVVIVVLLDFILSHRIHPAYDVRRDKKIERKYHNSLTPPI